MIYFEETLNLEPAAPLTMDKLVQYAQQELVPACRDYGIRILAAWYSHTEWFGQIRHVYEFENFAAFGEHWNNLKSDPRWIEIEKFMDDIAPQRSFNLLEDLGPIPAEVTEKVVQETAEKPLGVYSLAILHVVPGMMEQIKTGLAESAGNLPIVARCRPVSGNKNVFIDVWKGPIGQEHYKPAEESSKSFFEPLRIVAPREKVISVYALPYSALR